MLTIVKQLLENRTTLIVMANDNIIALYKVAYSRYKVIIRLLLSNGINLECKDYND